MRDINVNYFQLTQRQLIGCVLTAMEAMLLCWLQNLRAPLILIVKVYMMTPVMIPVVLNCVPDRPGWLVVRGQTVFTL